MAEPVAPARILIVEDEAVIAKDIERCVTASGYVVKGIVHTAEAAVESAASGVDLVLMDVMLQGMHDGTWAAARIRADYDVPVVFITAFGDEETRGDARASDPRGYLMKPFEDDDLLLAIKQALPPRAA